MLHCKSFIIEDPKELKGEVKGSRGYLYPIVSSLRTDSDNERVIGIPVNFRGKDYPVRFWRYRKNVAVKYRHGLNTLLFQELGRWEDFNVDDEKRTIATAWFDMHNPDAKERYRMHVEGVATDWSIGFREDAVFEGDDANELYRQLGLTEDGSRALVGIEYVELSTVPEGAQPDAHDLELKQKFYNEVKSMLIQTDSALFDRISKLEKQQAEIQQVITEISRASKEPQKLKMLLEGLTH